MPTSWLWCTMIYGAAAKIWARGDVWKGLQTPKVWRHGKADKKMHWCWDRVRNNKRCLVHSHALQSGMCWGKLVVLQDILYVAAVYTAGNLQCFQGHRTRWDDLGHQVLFPAIAGPLSFNPYCKLIDLYLKSNQVSSLTTLTGRVFQNLLSLMVRNSLLITNLNVFMVSLHPFVPVPTFSFS